ncbi:MAG: nuclear transport factor 2 family protein [Acidimicrobiia bacterium]
MVDLGAVWDEHIRREFVLRDADSTMRTMADEPVLVEVPVGTGGRGREAAHAFYRDYFIPAWPDDAEVVPISRTVDDERVVDEILVRFTHSRVMPFWLPGVAPTGRRVELPHVVVVGFDGGEVAYEHVYWDQASLLVQIGLLDPEQLPVLGAEQARRLVEHDPSNDFIQRRTKEA